LQFQDWNDRGLDGLAGDFDLFVADVDVDLGTDAEFAGQVNARFD